MIYIAAVEAVGAVADVGAVAAVAAVSDGRYGRYAAGWGICIIDKSLIISGTRSGRNLQFYIVG